MKDPYILEDGTLKNLLGITNHEELKEAETNIAYIKLLNAENNIKQEFDSNMFKSIHKHIFEDIFEWAGEFRKTPIYKEEIVIPGISLEYSSPENIEKELEQQIEQLNQCKWDNMGMDEISEQFTKHLAKIWRVHPFRDGNTRTTLTFANLFAKQHGFEMDLGMLLDELGRIEDKNTGKILRYSVRDKFVLAALDEKDYPEPEALKRIIKLSIEKGISQKIKNLNEIMER